MPKQTENQNPTPGTQHPTTGDVRHATLEKAKLETPNPERQPNPDARHPTPNCDACHRNNGHQKSDIPETFQPACGAAQVAMPDTRRWRKSEAEQRHANTSKLEIRSGHPTPGDTWIPKSETRNLKPNTKNPKPDRKPLRKRNAGSTARGATRSRTLEKPEPATRHLLAIARNPTRTSPGDNTNPTNPGFQTPEPKTATCRHPGPARPNPKI